MKESCSVCAYFGEPISMRHLEWNLDLESWRLV